MGFRGELKEKNLTVHYIKVQELCTRSKHILRLTNLDIFNWGVKCSLILCDED